MAVRRSGIAAPGLRKFRRTLRRLAPETDKLLRLRLRRAAEPILARSRDLAPHLSGRLASSLRISVQQRGVAITDRVPYAAVIHWGGTTGVGHGPGVPFSGSVHIKPSLFVVRAVDENTDRVLEESRAAVEEAAVKEGWR